MSTLAAARADNFYYSKNYNPEKVPPKKSELAQEKPFKVVQGQRVGGSKVRYETPFHVRCESCENMIAKGVRFNSIKTWVDNFHSTKIYEFRMKCPQCPQKFVVRTDPENCEYNYISGAHRIFQAKDCTDESRIRDEAVQQKVQENPFYKLEVQFKDKEAYGSAQENIEKLQQHQQERGTEDFELNRMLRKEIKKSKETESLYMQEKREKNLHIPLLKPEDQDGEIADQIFKTKMIKKEEKLEHYDKEKSKRDKLKEKLKNIHPSFRKILKNEMKAHGTIHSSRK